MKQIIIFLLLVYSSSHFAQITAGDNLFNVVQIHTVSINFSQANYWTQLVNNKAYDDANDSSTYIPAQVIIDGNALDSVGVQFKGNSSYYNYPGNKKPFTLSFDEFKDNQKYDGLGSVNLNNCYQDPSFMREKLFLDFLNSMGLYAPRSNYAKVYINGTYWGFYQIGERVNKTFCNDRFGNKSGNLFKGDAGMAACADLKYHGNLTSYYNCYTLKTNTTANNWSDLINLTRQINTTTNGQFKDSVDTYLNSNSFIGAWAACNMFVDFDSYAFRFVHNYYIYHNQTTNKFEWIIWDVSTAFGMDVPGTVASIEAESILYIEPNAIDRPLAYRMMNDTNYKKQYLTYICDYLRTFQPAVLNPKIDSLYDLIKNDVYADNMKMYSNSDFDNNIAFNITVGSVVYPGLKTFIQNRSLNILNELNSIGANCSALLNVNEISPYTEFFGIYPNPSDGRITIIVRDSGEQLSIKIYDSIGKIVYSSNTGSGLETTKFDLNLPGGIYNVVLQNGQKTETKKIIINK